MEENRVLKKIEDPMIIKALDEVGAAFTALDNVLKGIVKPARETSLGITKLEEAFMWISRSLTENGIQTH